jgi:CBS domain-containing protein
MIVSEVCTRAVVTALPATTIAEAAAMMRRHHVGNVVVVDRDDRRPTPLGVVTDRDIVVEVVAKGVDPVGITLGDLLTEPVELIQETATGEEALRRMNESAMRRLPVIDAGGGLVGIVSVDDLLPRLASRIGDVAYLVQRSRAAEARTRK